MCYVILSFVAGLILGALMNSCRHQWEYISEDKRFCKKCGEVQEKVEIYSEQGEPPSWYYWETKGNFKGDL